MVKEYILTNNQKLAAELKWLIDSLTLNMKMNSEQMKAYKKLIKAIARLNNT